MLPSTADGRKSIQGEVPLRQMRHEPHRGPGATEIREGDGRVEMKQPVKDSVVVGASFIWLEARNVRAQGNTFH